jgi:hypothetical protein
METKKLKLLNKGRKGILLPTCPYDYHELCLVISRYFNLRPENFIISFKDQEGDECEISDQETYEAAFNEFSSKIVLTLINKEANLPSPNSKVLLKYFKKRSRSMALFDLTTEKTEYFKLPQGILFKEYAAWVDLPWGDIFYCGGGHPVSSDEAYIINPQSKTFKKLPNMHYTRHSHGIAYQNGAVYVFGGIQNILFYGTMTKKCERFILEDNVWEEIGDLESPRADVGACVDGNDIYLLGKGCQSIVQYNSNDVNIVLGEDSGGSLIAFNNAIYAFHGNFIKICEISSKRVIEKIELPGNKSWWSHMPPVLFGDFIYFVWWEEPGWVCKFNIKTKEFVKIFSFRSD